jgi:7,8-dihydropterin-6-yl-methyl-4-(beta-D-ribofuranosyl)aminobenzene 5'-phosphate synthase
MRLEDIKVELLFDNEVYCSDSNLDSLWGFSCFIETPYKKILFDTGSNGRVLIKNINKMGVDISSIDIIFISHSHWDHIGGIDSILELNPSVHIFVTPNISKNFIRDLNKLSNGVVVIEDTPKEIALDIYSTGFIGKDMMEQSIILDTNKGLIVISGCAHGGIENIAKIAKKFLKKEIFLLLGGFHLKNKKDKEILKAIKKLKKLDIKYVAPSHCSGDRAKELFYKEFRENYIESGLGANINFKGNNIVNYCF